MQVPGDPTALVSQRLLGLQLVDATRETQSPTVNSPAEQGEDRQS